MEADLKRAPDDTAAKGAAPMAKRLRPAVGELITTAASEPAMLTESPFEEEKDTRQDYTPPNSPSQRQHQHHQSHRSLPDSEIPPAPPSTPASVTETFSQQDGDEMMIMPGIVRNTSLLERQLLASKSEDDVVTPAPTKSTRAGAGSYSNVVKDDFDDWAVGERYQMLRILGRGSYGEVAQAKDEQMGAFVAIKRITSAFEQEVDAIRLYREMHILRRLRGHQCIIQLLDVVQPPSDNLDDFHDLYLVFEYVDTDLYKLIMSPQYLTTEHIQTFLYQMLAGLNYIHSSSVIHRDLKPANILLNEDCSLKICDFGLARIVNPETMSHSREESSGEEEEGNEPTLDPSLAGRKFGAAPQRGLTRQLTKHVVTRWYRAPELILIQPYTSAVDIWSMGCILAELLSMQEGSVPGYQDRAPLFPGGSCYPLSGEGGSVKTDERLDQLNVIFGVIGTPEPGDVNSIGTANEYIKTLGEKKGKPFETLFPAADPAALDLLHQMLQFNPKERCTAAEALDHEFLRVVRAKEMERRADQPLVGPDFLESNHVDIDMLKRRTYEEVLEWKQPPQKAKVMTAST